MPRKKKGKGTVPAREQGGPRARPGRKGHRGQIPGHQASHRRRKTPRPDARAKGRRRVLRATPTSLTTPQPPPPPQRRPQRRPGQRQGPRQGTTDRLPGLPESDSDESESDSRGRGLASRDGQSKLSRRAHCQEAKGVAQPLRIRPLYKLYDKDKSKDKQGQADRGRRRQVLQGVSNVEI